MEAGVIAEIIAAVALAAVAVLGWALRLLYSRTASNNEQSGRLRERVGRLEERMSTVTASLDDIQGNVSCLRAEVSEMARNVAVLVDRERRAREAR